MTVRLRRRACNPERSTPDGGRAPVDRADALSAIAAMENGALATFLWSGVTQHPGDNFIEIFGTEGTLRYAVASPVNQGRILGARVGDAAPREILIPPDEARPWAAESDFIQAVRDERRSGSPSFWDGLKYMEMTEAIFRSADQGRTVDLAAEFGS